MVTVLTTSTLTSRSLHSSFLIHLPIPPQPCSEPYPPSPPAQPLSGLKGGGRYLQRGVLRLALEAALRGEKPAGF